ncbi:MAG: bifunctional oligoribonuclease/PAP phosphatase NrnA [Candidatus Cloacimonadota bacterium]|nr:MAG: bifunctional oligoribonuclease/PAP phosphatase NrnA [Candidatus Cloacimonadota bacterium]
MIKEIKTFFNKHKHFLIATHLEPDGDAIGSELAMALQLKKLSKSVSLINPEAVPQKYQFLPGWQTIKLTKPTESCTDAAIFLDIGNPKRASWIFDYVKENGLPILNIDHHISNTRYGDINYIDCDTSSTCECIFDIFASLGYKPAREICDCLATGIITDTGRFSFNNTSEKTFRTCAELAHCGTDFHILTNTIYKRRSLGWLKLLNSVMSTIKVRNDIAFIRLTKKMLKETQTSEEESEGFVNYALSLDGIRAAVFFRERISGEIRVSLRAKDDTTNVNAVAAQFKGGGHKQAAGFTICATPEELEEQIILTFQDTWSNE